ncbi:TetR/AcrR family transcriptional regulator [Acinetobacter gerneri]|uniref:TetR/AcrR family transcriptional regulator n=1 Tax=Acinetobacter gerneri TaxID=202952 RepID=UPI0029358D09|nr:TetR/AcrR family transcriptional regulator [Acinetobacter gerneri]MDV2440615.1 TetR/AcrR family transcriptional regulator [Acinetobacter gerneri]
MLKKRGRPPCFDRDILLHRAMNLFWEKGYESTQLIDLTNIMNINPPSFYATFGSKEKLFYECVQLYINTIGSKSINSLNYHSNVKDALRGMLEAVIQNATSSKSGGCLMVLGIVNCSQDNIQIWEYLKNERIKVKDFIETRLKQAITDRELPSNTNTFSLSEFFLGITQAISFQARDGATKDELTLLINPALAVLELS